MSRRAALVALAPAVLAATGARAQPAAPPSPTTSVTGCPFDDAALAAALAIESRALPHPPPASAAVAVTCDAAGMAEVTASRADHPPEVRSVDLVDVPAALAARVVALIAVATWSEPAPPPPPPTPPEPLPPSPTPPATTPVTFPVAPPDDRGVAPPVRRAALLGGGLGRRPLGVDGRALARMHDGTTTLWGGGAGVRVGPAAVGVVAAATRVDHALGRLTPWLVAADVGVTVACAGATCAGLRGEVGRIAVAATAADPMLATRPLAATYLHAAAELSLGARIAELELAAVLGVGASRGVIARVDREAVAVVAGWTLTGALEVRR